MYYMALGKFPLPMLFDGKLHNGVYCKEDKTCEVWMNQIKQMDFLLSGRLYIWCKCDKTQVKTQVKWLDKNTDTHPFWYFFGPIILYEFIALYITKKKNHT